MRAVVGVVVLGSVAVLVGCSSPEPAPPVVAPSSSEAASEPVPDVEPSPVFARPELPVAATVPDAAGAEAFVRYWYELVDYAFASGDVQVLADVSHVDCVACGQQGAKIRSVTDTGAVWQDVHYGPEQFEAAEPDADGISLSTGLVLFAPGATVRQPDGTVAPVTGTEVDSVKFWAQWTGDHWQTFAIAFPDRQG